MDGKTDKIAAYGIIGTIQTQETGIGGGKNGIGVYKPSNHRFYLDAKIDQTMTWNNPGFAYIWLLGRTSAPAIIF
jgi:hypothetical protein